MDQTTDQLIEKIIDYVKFGNRGERTSVTTICMNCWKRLKKPQITTYSSDCPPPNVLGGERDAWVTGNMAAQCRVVTSHVIWICFVTVTNTCTSVCPLCLKSLDQTCSNLFESILSSRFSFWCYSQSHCIYWRINILYEYEWDHLCVCVKCFWMFVMFWYGHFDWVISWSVCPCTCASVCICLFFF